MAFEYRPTVEDKTEYDRQEAVERLRQRSISGSVNDLRETFRSLQKRDETTRFWEVRTIVSPPCAPAFDSVKLVRCT